MVLGIVSSAFSLLGAVVGVCEGVTKAAVGAICQPSVADEEPDINEISGLRALLETLQLTTDGGPEPVLQACVSSWLSDEQDGVSMVTIIDLVFVVAIKRSGKSASWAVQYARLCSNLKAAAQPLSLEDTVQDALYGRSTEEYCRMTFRTVTVDHFGRKKHPQQVSEEAADLRGSLRFIACLFKEHLLPINFIHTLVLDFLGHLQAAGQGGASVHNQALVALGLVSALQCCADAYVCSEALRSPELAGGSAEAHIRAINLTLLRLQPRIDPFDELRADMQAHSLLLPLRLCHLSTVDLQFKLSCYSSSVFASGPQQHFGPRRSEDSGATGLRGVFPLRATTFA
ncbi:hypothetical protein COCSUDRAFT_47525 [Coccomyxa subellipsoidea C-169]|uniref:Uncharacterized protein n=1 Tax=Coccomyxa subellipsoidea (strain C-169) TaxID=574566 RepID=I0YXP9_COCSC|nr:hypothetical protein COCSUDRAFT_47525 [Coccomyxa subellipsoidea C-169]EIE23168.1 hypothetical protein COCSUDRAFT_47525 [Coccomyxa subellipsoidea C-169]|eukprot:XP_005647712.1 hypothetical protein COCSUDRAFT_47525 [Coccomyxa subellipsoidea C-169]